MIWKINNSEYSFSGNFFGLPAFPKGYVQRVIGIFNKCWLECILSDEIAQRTEFEANTSNLLFTEFAIKHFDIAPKTNLNKEVSAVNLFVRTIAMAITEALVLSVIYEIFGVNQRRKLTPEYTLFAKDLFEHLPIK